MTKPVGDGSPTGFAGVFVVVIGVVWLGGLFEGAADGFGYELAFLLVEPYDEFFPFAFKEFFKGRLGVLRRSRYPSLIFQPLNYLFPLRHLAYQTSLSTARRCVAAIFADHFCVLWHTAANRLFGRFGKVVL